MKATVRQAVVRPAAHLAHWRCPITGADFAAGIAEAIGEELLRSDRERAELMLLLWCGRHRAEIRREE